MALQARKVFGAFGKRAPLQICVCKCPGGYLTKFYTGRLRPEVQTLTLLYTVTPQNVILTQNVIKIAQNVILTQNVIISTQNVIKYLTQNVIAFERKM